MKKFLISLLLLLICSYATISVSAKTDNITLFENNEYTTTIFYESENNTEIITTATELAKDNTIIISLYNDNRLVNLRVFKHNESSNVFTTTESKEFNAVKVFIWENVNSLKPTCSLYNKNASCEDSSNENDHIIMVDEFITMPTCTENGILGTRHCVECEKTFDTEKTISALGHNEVIDEEITPTCTSIGFTEGSHCERCDEILKVQFSVPATGHNPSDEANCQHAQTCLNCGITLEEKTEHDYVNFVCSVCQQRNITPTEGLSYQKYKDGDGNFFYRVKGIGTATDKDIVIPSSYEGIPVTGMDYPCFYGNTNITSVWLPDSIEYIGLSVFRECSNLEYVNIPSSVNCIEGAAFEDCYNLKSEIIIPDGVTTIENSTFCNCYDLESVVLPNSLKNIESSAFYNCFKLKSVNLPEGLETIGNSAFKATDIETLRIPSTVQTIGESVFYLCNSIKTIYLPNNVLFVQNFDTIFEDCRSITNIFYDGTCLEWQSNGGNDRYNVVCEKSVKPTDHYVVATPAVEPTCTKTGLTEGAHCDVCDKIIVKQTVVAANGHTHVDGICTICSDNIRDFSGGNGTVEYPYLIADKHQFNNVRNYNASCFKFTSNITFDSSDFSQDGDFYNNGHGWIPIDEFSGIIDANNFSLKNIIINGTSHTGIYDYAGIIKTNYGTIKNLKVEDIYSVTDENTDPDGWWIAANKTYASGLVIFNEESGVIENCSVSGTVIADISSTELSLYSYAGGIATINEGEINRCFNNAKISAYSYIGRTMTHTNFEPVYSYAGGIAATSGGETAIINNCYNRNSVFSKCSASLYSDKYYTVSGGIAGHNYATIANCYNVGTVDYDMYAGRDVPSSTKIYGYCNNIGNSCGNTNATFTNCYSEYNYTLEEMTNREVYEGFDFESIWNIGLDAEYPYPTLR